MNAQLPLRQDVQLLRGLAVLCVVVYHSTSILSGGFLGVDIFFVISGFVIMTQVDRRTKLDFGPRQMFDFWRRRVARIVPNLVVVLLFWIAMAVFIQERERFLATVTFAGWALLSLGNLAAMRDVGNYFGPEVERQGLLHLWSLGVEEQFYLVFPILLLLAARLVAPSVRRHVLQLICAVCLITSLALFWSWGNRLPVSIFGIRFYEVFAFYSPVTRAWQFFAGALVALWRPRGVMLRSPVVTSVVRVTGVILIAGGIVLGSGSSGAIGGSVAATIGAVTWILAGDMRSTTLPPCRFLIWLGGISYAVYLLHLPLVVASRSLLGDVATAHALAGACSLPLGWLLTTALERPWRSRVLGATNAWPYAVFVLLAGLILTGPASTGLQFTIGRHLPSSEPDISRRAARSCVDVEPTSSGCWFGRGVAPRFTAFLVGDSIAYAVAEGVIDAVNETGGAVFVSSRSGCPFVDGMSSGKKPLDCSLWQREMRLLI